MCCEDLFYKDVDTATIKVYNTKVDNATFFFQEAHYVNSIYPIFSCHISN